MLVNFYPSILIKIPALYCGSNLFWKLKTNTRFKYSAQIWQQVGANLFDRADALISAFGSRAVEPVGDSQAYAGARRNLAVNIEARLCRAF